MKQISPAKLFLVIINSIIGGGLFVNLAFLGNSAGSWSGILYLIGYAIFFPIIFSIGYLAQKQQLEGGMYQMVSSRLGQKIGFLTSWSYFLGRAVSVAVLLQALATNLKIAYPTIILISDQAFTGLIAGLMISAHLVGLSGTGIIQYFFTSFKIIPIFALSTLGIGYFSIQNFNFAADFTPVLTNFFQIIPSYVYALQGFTIVVHNGHLIKDPKKLLKTLVLSTFCCALICAAFQSIVFGVVGLSKTSSFLAAYMQKINITNNVTKFMFQNLINIAIFSSCFMILTGNSKNLFALANNNMLPLASLLNKKINNVAVFCLLIHAGISLIFLALCKNIPSLQAASVFASFCAYGLCTLAAIKQSRLDNKNMVFLISLLGIISSIFILKTSYTKIMLAGISIEFIIIFTSGVFGSILKKLWEKSRA